MRIIYILAFCFLTLVSAAQSYQAPVFKEDNRLALLQKAFPILDSTIIPLIKSKNIPGMAFGIVSDGKLIYTKYYGKSNIEKNIAVGKNTAFRIASMTKSATAMAILQLRDAGKINLDGADSQSMQTIMNDTEDGPLFISKSDSSIKFVASDSITLETLSWIEAIRRRHGLSDKLDTIPPKTVGRTASAKLRVAALIKETDDK